MKKFFLSLFIITTFSAAHSQNWQYVGDPYINHTVGYNTYLYFGDMEFNSSGDIFIGYWQYSGICNFAKYSSGAWAQLPSPGTFPVSQVDIEVQGNDYYYAYSGVRGSNMYAYVTKYNGTGWDRVGDSLLLGNSGSGGYFDFLLDNNGVPTLLGVPGTGSNKQVVQYTGGAWTNTYTIPNSAAAIFRENCAVFDAQNKLLCATQGFVTVPTVSYYNVVLKIDGNTATTVGDTLSNASSVLNSKVRLDANGTPYLMFSLTIAAKPMAYKLNGNTWNFIADTAADQTQLLSADVSGDGQVVFNTLSSNIDNSLFIYKDNTRLNMDSLNISGFAVGSIADVVIPAGSTDVYTLAYEIKSDASADFSVLKHDVSGATTAIKDISSPGNTFSIYPNPCTGTFMIQQKETTGPASVRIYNTHGQVVYNKSLAVDNNKVVTDIQTPGIYFVELATEKGFSQRNKLIIQ